MFVTHFKNTLKTLPNRDEGCDAFMRCIGHNEGQFSQAADVFFKLVTNYAIRRSSLPNILPIDYDPRFLLTAFSITRFPIETLGTPEEPYRFTLIDKAWKYLQVVDIILHVHHAAEDVTVDDFVDDETASEYLDALNEFRNAWFAVWETDSSVSRLRRSLTSNDV